MKHLLRSSWLLLPFLITAPAWAKTPPKPPVEPLTITLARGFDGKPLGVEPEGGRFQGVLPEHAKPGESGEALLKTVSPNQKPSTLAIYASDSPTMHEEKPLARLNVAGLPHGLDRIKVKFTLRDARTLTIEAWAPSGQPLAVTKPTVQELQLAKINPPVKSTKVGGPAPIASRDPGPSTTTGLRQSIGVRTAGGLVQPLLVAGASPNDIARYHLRPRSPDQTTADVSFYTGDSQYLELDKLWNRYLISGIPTGPNRRIELELKVGTDGKVGKPIATETVSKQTLKVERYSESAAERLQEAPHEIAPLKSGRIPAAPAGG